jgi:hypothetical protein
MRSFLLPLALMGTIALAPRVAFAQDVYSFATAAPPEPAPVISADSALHLMKERLRNLVAAQEGYWLAHGTFTTDVSQLDMHVTGLERRSKASVAVIFAGGRGWSAVSTHGSLAERTCVVFVGEPENLPRLPVTLHAKRKAEQPGVPVCDTP